MVRCTPTASAISATVCCLFPSGPVAWYMRRTVAAWRAFSLGLRPPVRPHPGGHGDRRGMTPGCPWPR